MRNFLRVGVFTLLSFLSPKLIKMQEVVKDAPLGLAALKKLKPDAIFQEHALLDSLFLDPKYRKRQVPMTKANGHLFRYIDTSPCKPDSPQSSKTKCNSLQAPLLTSSTHPGSMEASLPVLDSSQRRAQCLLPLSLSSEWQCTLRHR